MVCDFSVLCIHHETQKRIEAAKLEESRMRSGKNITVLKNVDGLIAHAHMA